MKKSVLNGQTVLTYIIFAVLFTACIWATIHALKPIDRESYQVITVQNGDTLWGIAKNYKEEMNSTAFIHWVEDVNKVNANKIEVGEQLVIPIKKDEEPSIHRVELASK